MEPVTVARIPGATLTLDVDWDAGECHAVRLVNDRPVWVQVFLGADEVYLQDVEPGSHARNIPPGQRRRHRFVRDVDGESTSLPVRFVLGSQGDR